jgi:hypothetical protein
MGVAAGIDWIQLAGNGASALLGAIVGGWMVNRGALHTLREQDRLRRQDAKAQLQSRAKYVLQRLRGVAQALEGHSADKPISIEFLESALRYCASFQRLGDYGVYFRASEFDDKLRTFMTEAESVVVSALAGERESAAAADGVLRGISGSHIIQRVGIERGQRLARIRVWPQEITVLLDALNDQ